MHVEIGLTMCFLDSYNFLPMKLSKIITEIIWTERTQKGWFSHYFNIKNNQNYIGPFPRPDYYGVKYMSKQEGQEFLEWHCQQQEGKVFDFLAEMEAYCLSDVHILREACLKCRHLLLEETGEKVYDEDLEEWFMKNAVDPFNYITIASICIISDHYISKSTS